MRRGGCAWIGSSDLHVSYATRIFYRFFSYNSKVQTNIKKKRFRSKERYPSVSLSLEDINPF